MGTGPVVGQAIIDGVDAVTFTGSVATGRKVVQAAAARMIRVQCEMGGKNPLVVLDDADFETAVNCAVDGSFFQTGQRCTASSRLIVTEGIHDRFVAAVAERLDKLVIDHSLKPTTQVGPVVDQRQLDQDLKYIDIGEKEGAKKRVSGQRLNRETPGFYLSPTLFTETNNAMRINREEIFGPVASVIRVKNYDEALHVANDTDFGLSAGIITTSQKHCPPFPGQHPVGPDHGQSRHRGPRLSRAVWRPQRIKLRSARAGALCGGILHHRQNVLRRLTRAVTIDRAAAAAFKTK